VASIWLEQLLWKTWVTVVLLAPSLIRASTLWDLSSSGSMSGSLGSIMP